MQRNLEPFPEIVRFAIRNLILATILGVCCSVIVFLFQTSLRSLYRVIEVVFLERSPEIIYVFPALGGLLAGTVAYIICPEARGEGVPHYIKTVNDRRGFFPRAVGFYKFIAACLTMGFYGSGGLVGPTVLMNAHFGSWLTMHIRKVTRGSFRIPKDDLTLGAICAAAAALGALFKSPVGAGIFAVEVLYASSIHYRNMFPAILSSSMGYASYCLITSTEPLFRGYPPGNLSFTFTLYPMMIITGIAAGAVGMLFIEAFKYTAEFFNGLTISLRYKSMLGGGVAGVTAMIFGKSVLGTGANIIDLLLADNILLLTGVVLILGKILATSFTIGSQGSAGFTMPSIVMGLLTGHVLGLMVGIPEVEQHFALMVTGMTGVLAAVMNIPLAAAVLAIEFFGPSYGVPAVIGSIIGFNIGRRYVIFEYTDRGKVVI